MERIHYYVNFIEMAVFVALLSLILFLGGFYLGFSETHELGKELTGISFSGGNLYRDRALQYGFVAILLLVSWLIYSFRPRHAKILGTTVLLLSIFPVWNLFVSTPAQLSRSRIASGPDLNFIVYLDLGVFPVVILLLFLCFRGAYQSLKQDREQTILE